MENPSWAREIRTENPWQMVLGQQATVSALLMCMDEIKTNKEGLVEVSIMLEWFPSKLDHTQRTKWIKAQESLILDMLEDGDEITWFSSYTWAIFLSCKRQTLHDIIYSWRVIRLNPMNLRDLDNNWIIN